MYSTRLVTLVQFGSSWEMSSVKDSLTMECTVKYMQALTGKSSFWLINLVICANFQIMICFAFSVAILVIYLTQMLKMDDNTATAIYHAFNMLCYFSPLFGAMLADSLLGKYK